jgi:Glycosyl hydrolase 2 galactose-binding domain-like
MFNLLLDGAWIVSKLGESSEITATVPSDIYSDLLNAKEIPDLFYRDNENDLQWIGESDWHYHRTFQIDSSFLKNTNIYLQCDGLDTLATVIINGKTIATTDNMFRAYEWSVKDFLKVGENSIEVIFASAVNYVKDRQAKAPHHIRGWGFFRKLVVKTNNRTSYDSKSAHILQSSLNIVIRNLDFIAQKSSLSSGVRSNKGIRNFICAPAMNNSPASGTPVITVNKASRNRLAVFNIFLDVFSGMVIWRNIFTAAMRTVIKVNVNGFIGLFRFSAEPSRVTNRSTKLFSGFCSFFAFIFGKRIFESVRKFCFELGVGVFKLFDSFLKFKSLMISNIHSKFEFVNPFAEIISFRENAGGIFAVKKNTEILEGTIRAFDFLKSSNCFVIPPGVISSELTKNRRPTISIAKIAIKVTLRRPSLNVVKGNKFLMLIFFSRNHNNLTMEVA